MTTPDPTRTRCLECGAWGPANEYHPFAYCVLIKAIGQAAARANIDAVVEYGRKLERAHLQAEGMAVVPGWQPIETKPRDHFPVLVWSEKLGQVVAFLDVTWAWWPCPAIEPLSSAPTHWRPLLPASPYGKASMQEASAEAQSAVANSPSMKAGKEESK